MSRATLPSSDAREEENSLAPAHRAQGESPPDDARRWALRAAWSVGALLCAVQYAARPSLWVDELAIVRNLADRSLSELLTQPLDFDQVAPAGFLLLEKLVGEAGGYSELALRALPFLSALLALALVAGLAARLVPGMTAIVPPLLLGLSSFMIAFGGQVKQYAGDVAAMAALILLAVTVPSWRTSTPRRAAALLLGAIAPWMSQPSLFALPAIALALIIDDWTLRRRLSAWTASAMALWASSGLASLVSSRARVAPETLQFMREYWHDGFPPVPTSWAAIKWAPYTIRMLVADVSNGVGSYLLAGLVALGGWVLWRRSRTTALILLMPAACVFVAAAARQYPLTDRLAFFLAPIVVVLVGVAGASIATRLGGGTAITTATVVALLLPSVAGLAGRLPPYRSQSVRPLLEVVRREMRAGDIMFIPYGSWQAWVHYAPRHGLAALPALLGSCHHDRTAAYEAEIAGLRGGGRTWILFIPTGRVDDPAVVQRAADAQGTLRSVRVERGWDARGIVRDVTLFLYDFSAGARAATRAPFEWPVGARGTTTDPSRGPPLPPAPQARECRGAAVPRRLVRSPRLGGDSHRVARHVSRGRTARPRQDRASLLDATRPPRS